MTKKERELHRRVVAALADVYPEISFNVSIEAWDSFCGEPSSYAVDIHGEGIEISSMAYVLPGKESGLPTVDLIAKRLRERE